MNPLYILMLTAGAVLVLVVLYGWSLPSKWRVEERITLRGSREMLFHYLHNLRNWEEWTIWNKDENPQFIFHYRGPDTGIGAQQCWKNGRQYGSTKIIDARLPERIEYLLVFKNANSHMLGTLELLPRGGCTEIVWRMTGDAGRNPIRRIMARFFMAYVQRDCHRSLERLKRLMESS